MITVKGLIWVALVITWASVGSHVIKEFVRNTLK